MDNKTAAVVYGFSKCGKFWFLDQFVGQILAVIAKNVCKLLEWAKDLKTCVQHVITQLIQQNMYGEGMVTELCVGDQNNI